MLRIGLPLVIALAGLVVAILGAEAALVFVASLYVRLSVRSQADRDAEAARRAEFECTGRWPED